MILNRADRPGQRPSRRGFAAITPAVLCLVMLTGAGCSAKPDSAEEKPDLDASEVCNASLSEEARASISKLLRVDTFTEKPKASLTDTVRGLKEQSGTRPIKICRIYANKSGTPALTAEYSWASTTTKI